MKGGQSAMRIFAMPVLLGLLSGIGLVSALAGDGYLDALSWAGLGAPVLAVAWAMRVRRS